MSDQKTEKKDTEQPSESRAAESKASQREVRENALNTPENKVQLDQAIRSNPNRIRDDSSIGEFLRAVDPTKTLQDNERAQAQHEAASRVDSFGIDFGDHVYTSKGMVEKPKLAGFDTANGVGADKTPLPPDAVLDAHSKSLAFEPLKK